MSHTPTPWRAWKTPYTGHASAAYYIFGSGKDGRSPAVAHIKQSTIQPVADNAEFIVRACNSHDALVAAVQAFVTYDADDAEDGVAMMLAYEDARTKALAALAALEGK